MSKLLFALPLALTLAMPASAQGFRPVVDRSEFLSLVSNRTLNIRIYGLSLSVLPSGQITGKALGSDITGSWSWQNGYFCREMDWGGDPIPYNCQLVEVSGNDLRFTTDQGAGDSAVLRLR